MPLINGTQTNCFFFFIQYFPLSYPQSYSPNYFFSTQIGVTTLLLINLRVLFSSWKRTHLLIKKTLICLIWWLPFWRADIVLNIKFDMLGFYGWMNLEAPYHVFRKSVWSVFRSDQATEYHSSPLKFIQTHWTSSHPLKFPYASDFNSLLVTCF